MKDLIRLKSQRCAGPRLTYKWTAKESKGGHKVGFKCPRIEQWGRWDSTNH